MNLLKYIFKRKSEKQKTEDTESTEKKQNLRSNLPYGQIEVYSLDDELLFRCGDKKANWYLSRNLAKKISENKIKFTFENKGSGDDSKILEIERRNVCAECGMDDIEKLTKHHIVPYSFRKFLDSGSKSILLIPLCGGCHDKYESKANNLRQDICKKYGVKMHVMVRENKVADSIGLRIYKKHIALEKHKIPKNIKKKLKSEIKSLKKEYKIKTKEKWKKSVWLRKNKKSENISYNYSEKIVEKLKTEDDIKKFESIWIKHLLDNMCLKYLDPKHIDYLKNYINS